MKPFAEKSLLLFCREIRLRSKVSKGYSEGLYARDLAYAVSDYSSLTVVPCVFHLSLSSATSIIIWGWSAVSARALIRWKVALDSTYLTRPELSLRWRGKSLHDIFKVKQLDPSLILIPLFHYSSERQRAGRNWSWRGAVLKFSPVIKLHNADPSMASLGLFHCHRIWIATCNLISGTAGRGLLYMRSKWTWWEWQIVIPAWWPCAAHYWLWMCV